MVDYIFKWIWQSLGIFILIFFVAMFLVLAKSYDIVDYETRTNQFTERILLYANEDGSVTYTDFQTDSLKKVIGGGDTESETFSFSIEAQLLDNTKNQTTFETGYYSENTFKRQNPVANIQKSYIKKESIRYVYFDDVDQNAKLTFTYIYKS